MTQNEINEAEWRKAANWTGVLGLYRSTQDSRLWVPKRVPWMGWTVNMAHPLSKLTLASLAIVPLALTFAVKVARRR